MDGFEYEIVVVDDASGDGTAEAVQALERENPRVRLIEREGARGLASAALAGWAASRGSLLAIMDGDGQHDPALLPRMIEAARDGAELVAASRYADAGPTGLTGSRHLISRAGTRLVDVALGVALSDPLSGFFLMRRAWYETAAPRASGVGFKILVDLVASAPEPPRAAEFPTALRTRVAGESKLDARVVADLAAMVVEKRTGGLIPARFVLFAAVGVSGVGVQLAAFQLLEPLIPTFSAPYVLAILTAMTWNFGLNNLLTFRDRRLRGWGLLRGWATFVAACALGAVINYGIGWGLHRLGVWDAAAGLVGALAAGVWNFAAARTATWAADRRPAQADL